MNVLSCGLLFRRVLAIILLGAWTVNILANPTGMTVVSGSALPPTKSGAQLTTTTITTTSQSAVLDWQNFNIAAVETTVFNQPTAYSIVINNIHDASASQIWGNLQANGLVVLMNRNGFFFGPDSFVKTGGGLIVSTANCIPPQNAGGSWEFNGPPPLKSIINYGQIQVGNGGPAFLIADKIENYGSIEAPGGNIGLAAGQTVLLSERPDGRGLSMAVTLPGRSVDNEGKLIADGGTIAMRAQVVNQNGFIQANSVRNQNGVIELVASDQLNLGADSQISASGDNSSSGSAGGDVTLESGNNFSDRIGSQITVTGGSQGGNGGNVEISAPHVQSLNSGINARAQAGWTAGKLLLDPDYIILDTSGSGSAGSGAVLAGDNPGGTLDLNVNTAFANLAVSDIILQAAYDITLAGGTSWNLSGTIGANLGGVTGGQLTLTLEAGGDIIFGDGSSISDANNWSVKLQAGYNFANNTIIPGVGNIYLNGSLNGDGVGGSIQTAGGSIDLEAGQDILAGSGSLTDNNGYLFAVESGSGSITLSAGRDIQVGFGTVATLGGGGITATAGRNIQVGFGSIATLDGGDISVTAGQDIQVGSGSITTVNGGNITATATAGSVNTGTDPGGYDFSAEVTASDTTDPLYQAVTVNNPYPGVLGGISTAAGGDVKITAGLDIISLLPQGSESSPSDAGSGAFGPGNVTLSAGRNVVGHYVLANGTGVIKAGVNAGTTAADPGCTDGGPEPTPQEELALSLINGSWTVQAAQDINLQEVRNPNGIFNEAGGASYKGYHLFDYWTGDATTPCDSVTLNAGNSVQLLGDNVPRNSDESPSVPIIYPPMLNITAGTGGVVLGADIILFPSAQGSLSITTTGGGSFESQAYVNYLADLALYANGQLDSPPAFPGEAQLIMSDSGRTPSSYAFGVGAFGVSDHATMPVHFNDPTTVALNLSGDMDNINLAVPEAAQINVVGNMNNSGFTGQNLFSGDVTSIYVGVQAKVNMENSGLLDSKTDSSIKPGGDILNQGEFSTVNVASLSDLSQLDHVDINGQFVSLADLANRLHYDATTGTLTYQGTMSTAYEGYLTSLTIWDVDQNGNPLYAADGITPQTHTVSFLDSVTAGKLYNESLNVPTGQNPGYFIGGGGQFNINAHNVNLGSTLGIRSLGPGDGSSGPGKNGALAAICHFTQGADINLTLSGNLDIFSTTICALNGGNITIDAAAAGYVNVGSTSFTGDNDYVRGIFIVGPGSVSVIAKGDINVNGSRIATYDGGNVFVESLTGNVDAGSGGSGAVAVEEIYVDPVTYQVYSYSPTIPLSGILAMTFPPRNSLFPAPTRTVGNILVETPQGNITASAAGIVQMPLNGGDSSGATVTLLAGEDAIGNVISPDRDIDVTGSGVVGSTVTLRASGNINGTVFARNDLNITAVQNVDVTALAVGKADISGASLETSTIIGVGGINAIGDMSGGVSLLSNNQVSGDTSGAKSMAQGTAANATAQAAASDDSAKTAVADTQTGDDEKNKKGKGAALMQKTGRVTVLLPPKKLSQNQTSNNHL
jgi:filamentous hemagglutinin family protein